MGNNTWENLLDPHPVARGSAKSNFTTFQDISPTPLPLSYANELKIGTQIYIRATGEFSTTGTPTFQIGLLYGATAGAAGGIAFGYTNNLTTGTGAAAWPWIYQWQGMITAVGASGTLDGQGILYLGTSLTAFSLNPGTIVAANRIATINTTTDNAWGVGASWGTASASNSVTTYSLQVQLVNQGKT